MVRILREETRRFEEEILADYNRVLSASKSEICQEKDRFDQKYGITYPRDYVEFDEETQRYGQECQGFFPPANQKIGLRRVQSGEGNMLFIIKNPDSAFLLFQNPVYAASGGENTIYSKLIGNLDEKTVPGNKIDRVREITSPALLEEIADGKFKLVRKGQGKMDMADRPSR